LDIVSATLEIDMAATGPRPKGAFRKHQSALDALRAFQQRVAARHVAPGLDVVQTWREAYRLEKVAGAMVKARPKWDLPSVDYDLLGVAALSAAFAVLVCAEFASILRRTRTRWGLRRFAPIAAACLASCAVALGGNHFAWIPALLLAVAVPFLATGRRLPTILLTGSALLCCAAGLSYDGVLAVPPAVFALVWPGGVLPETGNAWAVTVRAVLFAVLAAVAGCWIACLLIGFGSPLWVFPPVAGIIALTPRGYPRALQFMGPAVLCCALAHVSFLVADGRQDARYAGAVLRDMKDESDLADRARAKAETMPLPAEP
jgi:hypothetical protein